MAVYAIGDLQGCYDELQALLEKLSFDPARDRLWLAGDLVLRGPKSLDTLRFVRSLGAAAVSVLGNHDLHLIASAHGVEKRSTPDVAQVLAAPDGEELVDWLRHRAVLHHDAQLGYTMVHAGLPPSWDLAKASACARELETALHGPGFREFLQHMYGNRPERWSESLRGWDRLRFITNCFTRLRFCDAEGRLALDQSGPPGSQPAPFVPWFEVPGRASRELRIVFGHWSTLGTCTAPRVYPLDSGCVWGGALTALRLADAPERISHPCPEHRAPRSD